MTDYLAAMAIGPVQDFIAQARRSRDLWFGSHLLSEIARAAARAVAETGGRLIFPALSKGDIELEPCDGLTRDTTKNQPPLAIANKLLFECDSEQQTECCVMAAIRAAENRWDALAEMARSHAGELVDWAQIRAVWQEQISTVLEIYAASTAMLPQGICATRGLLDQQLAARKGLRDFRQIQHHRIGAPKSSFDGARVSVLRPPGKSANARRKFRIPQGENLDAVGVVKRTGGLPEQFVPIANVALAPWLLAARCDPRLRPHIEELEQVMLNSDLRELFGRVMRPLLPAGGAFCTDAQVLLEGRLATLVAEGFGYTSQRQVETDSTYQQLSTIIRAIRQQAEAMPYPYVAVLVADGDRMGAALQYLEKAEELRQFSNQLGAFASEARRIVEQECLGSLLYAGGDDVVAFLPLNSAVHCADQLRRCFLQLMAPGQALPLDWANRTDESPQPTLSIGIGIGHVLSGMGQLLELGRNAESLAKGSSLPVEQQRNALGLIVDKRSGGQTIWRQQWGASESQSPIQKINAAIQLTAFPMGPVFLPSTKISQVRRDLACLPSDCPPDQESQWMSLMKMDIQRTLQRSGQGLNTPLSKARPSLSDFGLEVNCATYKSLRNQFMEWVALHLIAGELNRCKLPVCVQPEESMI